MDCITFEQNLEAYLAEEMPPAESSGMETHRVACTRCHALVERAIQLDALLRSGLRAVAVMTPSEQVVLRESVLHKAGKSRPSARRGWTLRLAGLAAALIILIAAALAVWNPQTVPTASAAEIIANSQAAMDKYADLDGVLHWKTRIEQWGPETQQTFTYDAEIWLDFDDPGRYQLYLERRGDAPGANLTTRMVRNGLDRMWSYQHLADQAEPTVDEIMLSSQEMRQLARWHVPSPFRDDLDRFADILPNVKVSGETTVAGRRAYVLRGTLSSLGKPDATGQLRPVDSTVTLIVDAETYWLLGREEIAKGESKPRIAYRTQLFEILPQRHTPNDAFTFTPPGGVQVRKFDGIDDFYSTPSLPAQSWAKAAKTAPFILLAPRLLPDDVQPPAQVLLQESPSRQGLARDSYLLIYRGAPGRQMVLAESMLPKTPALAARLVDVGGRAGWLENDLIDSRKFSLYLPNWDVAKIYGENGPPQSLQDRQAAGSVILQVWGLTVDEAIAVLESLERME